MPCGREVPLSRTDTAAGGDKSRDAFYLKVVLQGGGVEQHILVAHVDRQRDRAVVVADQRE